MFPAGSNGEFNLPPELCTAISRGEGCEVEDTSGAAFLAFPRSDPLSAGIPPAVTDDMLVAPYNDSAVATRMVAEHAQDLAAVIVEPLQRCTTSSKVGFFENQRAACTKYDVLLMFDEVVTGFRLAYGDAQETSGILLISMRCSGASSLGSLPVGNDSG